LTRKWFDCPSDDSENEEPNNELKELNEDMKKAYDDKEKIQFTFQGRTNISYDERADDIVKKNSELLMNLSRDMSSKLAQSLQASLKAKGFVKKATFTRKNVKHNHESSNVVQMKSLVVREVKVL
jgi:hypothetical protein